MSDLIRVNHTIYSWTSCSFKIDNQPFTGILDLSYEQKRERKVVFAARQDGTPLGKTSGKYTVPSFSLKMLKDSGEVLTDYLAGLGSGSYGDPEFQMLLQVAEPVPGAVPLTVFADVCTIDGKKDGHVEGIDELVTEFEIGCLFLSENGKALWSVVRGQQ